MTAAADHPTHAREAYPCLLSPLRVSPLSLRNRLVMGSMHMRLPLDAQGSRALAAFYAERARGGAALIVTGGVAPNTEGRMEPDAAVLDQERAIVGHAPIVAAVHGAGSAIVMQILHAGRYARHEAAVGPTASRSPINRFAPRPLRDDEIERTIEDYVRCAVLAQAAGYNGVDVMGSEGYLINQFTARRTNNRSDRWGGSVENRMRLPVEIVQRIRVRLGPGFAILYRISALDLVEDGSTATETTALAIALARAGVDGFSTGIGWHESRIPTIAYIVPRGSWRFAAARLKHAAGIPVAASNRINTPQLAEDILARGEADLVALARPLLADPDFLVKASSGRTTSVTPCMACNQACLDYIFTDRSATCLVNPCAGHELDDAALPARKRERIAVGGSGPAGLALSYCSSGPRSRGDLVRDASALGRPAAARLPGHRQGRVLYAARLLPARSGPARHRASIGHPAHRSVRAR